MKRYLRICDAYLKTFDDSADISEADPNARQMVTVWPRRDIKAVRRFDAESGDSDQECKSAVLHYAYAAAHVWKKKFELHGARVGVGRGPFLVAWAQTAAPAKGAVTVLTLDLSGSDNTEEIQTAFRLWARQIERDPQGWQNSWRKQDWRFYAASMLNTYGQRVIDALAIVRHAGFIG